MIRPILLILLVFFQYYSVRAQCPAAVSAAPCTGSEPLVIVDETIPQGTTKWFYGATTTFNSLTMRGGKLIVCGDLTVDKFYMDSGQIIINPGGRFVVGSGIGAGLQLFGNSSFYNYGILEIQRNLTMENGWASPAKPNILVNATPTSIFKMPNQYFVINNANSWLVNHGYAQFWGIITDAQSSPSSICLQYGSITQMALLINKVANTYRALSGTACVYVHQYSEFFGRLTNSPNIFACLGSGHTSNSGCIPFGCTPNNWGAAQVFTNCNNCATILTTLAAGFISINSTASGNSNKLNWEFESGNTSSQFIIERSIDGKNFVVIDSVMGKTGKEYEYIDAANEETAYYRIRYQEAFSRRTILSRIVQVVRASFKTRVYPSPFSGSFYIQATAANVIQQIAVYDMSGKMIPIRYHQEGQRWKITPSAILPKQKLIVQIISNRGIQVEKIISN